jgi:hypothetical protein
MHDQNRVLSPMSIEHIAVEAILLLALPYQQNDMTLVGKPSIPVNHRLLQVQAKHYPR